VRLGCFVGYDAEKLTGSAGPGWGRFYLFAEQDGLRGVSPCILHVGSLGISQRDPDEWTRRGVIHTGRRPIAVTLRMQSGLRVMGRVVDTEGKPVPDFEVRFEHDLNAESHTGYGDGIFGQSQWSDAKGRFAFEHVFPNTFYPRIPVTENNRPVWIHTQLRGRWLRKTIESVTPRRGERVIRLTLRVSRELPYRYFGRVTDESGRPMANANLEFGISRHRQAISFGDNHTFLHTTSDETGRFELRTATPYILWVAVNAEGHDTYNLDYEQQDRARAPGEWNIVIP
jgi:protocatechuate 3,4-dioxygenase beta subunit